MGGGTAGPEKTLMPSASQEEISKRYKWEIKDEQTVTYPKKITWTDCLSDPEAKILFSCDGPTGCRGGVGLASTAPSC